jgi:hypothetical protein
MPYVESIRKELGVTLSSLLSSRDSLLTVADTRSNKHDKTMCFNALFSKSLQIV